MADKKITDLPTASSVVATQLFELVNGSSNQKATIAQLAAFLETLVQTLTNKTINGAQNTLTVRLASDVTGTLPKANQAAQDMGGDVGGTTAASTISNLAVTKLAVGTKSYVLESFDSGAGAAVRWGLRDRPTLVNTTAGSSNDVVTTDANGNQVEVLIYRGTGVATWTGFASGTASRRLVVVNDSADSSALTLSASEVASVAANRMLLVGELASATVPFQSAVVLAYDATDSRWRHVGGSAIPASAISSGTIATTRGGTGQDSSAWTGMAYVASGTWSQASGVRYDSATGQLLLAPDKGVLFRNVADTFSGRLYGDVSGARTWLLPDATGTLVLTDNAQTLTNKTYSGGTVGGTFAGSATFSALQTFTGSTAHGATPALTGQARFSNGTARITVRNAGNTADLVALEIGSDNQWRAGNGGEPAGYVFHGGGNFGWYRSGNYGFYTDTTSFQFATPRHGFSVPYASEGRATQAMADANQVAAAAVYSRAEIKCTGALTAGRTLTLPHPASEDASYEKKIENATTGGFSITVSTGTGTTYALALGTKKVSITPDGVKVVE